MLGLLYNSLNLLATGVKHWTVSNVIVQKNNEVESFALQQLTSLNTRVHWCTVMLKDNTCHQQWI